MNIQEKQNKIFQARQLLDSIRDRSGSPEDLEIENAQEVLWELSMKLK
jgi:hypothetical protein